MSLIISLRAEPDKKIGRSFFPAPSSINFEPVRELNYRASFHTFYLPVPSGAHLKPTVSLATSFFFSPSIVSYQLTCC